MYIYHASIGENGKITGGVKGDSTGKEVCIRSWYSKPWNVCLRYKDISVARKVAEIGKKLCLSNLVGYNQAQRNTLYTALSRHNWNVDEYIASGEKTNTDCSAFQYAIWCCVLPEMRSTSNAPTTSTMVAFFKKYGFIAYTDKSYLTSEIRLLDGDILVKEGSHTVGVCLKNTIQKSKPGAVPGITVKKGSKGGNAMLLQMALSYLGYRDDANKDLVIDADFGTKSCQALSKFQFDNGLKPDKIYGANSLKKMSNLL